MMKVLLINPPQAASEIPQIPIGLAYIASVLENSGHTVRVLDLLVSRSDRFAVEKVIEDFDPAVVGITSVTMVWPDASNIMKWVKEKNPDIITVAGGPHVTFTWQEVGEKDPWIDYVVIGEGEKTIVELVSAIENGQAAQGIAGLAYRSNGNMQAGPKRVFEKDIKSIPHPARHLFPLSKYRALKATTSLSTGRGCPFSCAFCAGSKMVGNKPRLREPKDVVDEIESIIKLGFKTILFCDDHFGMKRSHAIAVCDEIIARDLDINLNIFIRADSAEPVLFNKLREAGCKRMLCGVESGVQELVNRIKKKTDLKMLKEKVQFALDMGFSVHASFIIGLPGETHETMQKSFEFAKSLNTFCGFHVFTPLPGSEITENPEKFGMRILHKDWKLYDADHVVTETEGLSAKELEKIVSDRNNMFEYLAGIEDQMWKNGEFPESKIQEINDRKSMQFLFDLLRTGFFEDEENGVSIVNCKTPRENLVKKAADHCRIDENEADLWLTRVMESGDLSIVEDGSQAKFVFSPN